MQFKQIICAVIFLWQQFHATNQQMYDIPSSPCPHIFQYKYDGNSWNGELELPSPPIEHHEVILNIILSLKAATTPDNVGKISIIGSPEEATKKILNGQPLMFRVTFPYRYPIPKLVQITYDGNLLCTGPEEHPNAGMVVSRIDLKHVMNTYTTYQPTSINNNLYNNYDQGFNKPNHQTNYGNQFTSNKPNYNTNYGTHYSPSNPYGDDGGVSMYPMQPQSPPSYPSQGMPSYPNQGMPSVMMSPPFPVTQKPITRPPITRPPVTRPPITRPPPTTPRPVVSQQPMFTVPNNDVNSICGTRHSETEITPFVYGGEATERGDWPWMVAIYINKPTGLKFTCGGTLVSSKTVITAAHCMIASTKTYRTDEVVLNLGRYSLIDWSEVGSVSTNVEQIIIHSDYKKQRDSYDADIAILVMTKRVDFNEFVRPACLWPGPSNIQEIVGKKGVVVGWGKDGTNHEVSNIPKKVDVPIVDSLTCVQTSEALSQAVSNRTFCAGTLNGDGPCHGDSGGGLTLYHRDRWTLRGIVSAGLSDANTGACKLNQDYVVFTDASYFTTWIRSNSQF